jgi:uncharacterized protein YeaO (DUF488 family)
MPSTWTVLLKRVYDEPADSDGFRVLVDRLWPRGLTKQKARLDAWLRDIAPSNELRKWFHAHPERWQDFRQRYLTELRTPAASVALQKLYDLLDGERTVSLLFASRKTDQNNATVLKEIVEGMKKPPKGTGAGARAQVRKRARR